METQERCLWGVKVAAERDDSKTLDHLKYALSAMFAPLGSFMVTEGECRKQGRGGSAVAEHSPELLDRLILQIGAA